MVTFDSMSKDYNNLIKDLDKYKWIDRPDLSIYDKDSIDEAIKFHRGVLKEIYTYNLNDAEIKRIEKICNIRLVKLMLYSEDSNLFSDSEKNILKRIMQNAKLEDYETLVEFIKLYIGLDVISKPLEIINEWKRELKDDLEIIKSIRNPLIIEYLTDTLKRRYEALRKCEKYYQKELMFKIDGLKRNLRSIVEEIQMEILRYKDLIRKLEKHKVYNEDIDIIIEDLQMISTFRDSKISKNAKILLSRFEENKDTKEIVNLSIKFYENFISHLENIKFKLEKHIKTLDTVKEILNEITNIVDDQTHDVSHILNPAVRYLNTVSKIISATLDHTKKKLSIDKDVKKAEIALKEFESIAKEIEAMKSK